MNLREFVLWNGVEWVPNVMLRPHWSWPRQQWALRRALFAAAYMNWKRVRP